MAGLEGLGRELDFAFLLRRRVRLFSQLHRYSRSHLLPIRTVKSRLHLKRRFDRLVKQARLGRLIQVVEVGVRRVGGAERAPPGQAEFHRFYGHWFEGYSVLGVFGDGVGLC